jgi:hypothetical protein
MDYQLFVELLTNFCPGMKWQVRLPAKMSLVEYIAIGEKLKILQTDVPTLDGTIVGQNLTLIATGPLDPAILVHRMILIARSVPVGGYARIDLVEIPSPEFVEQIKNHLNDFLCPVGVVFSQEQKVIFINHPDVNGNVHPVVQPDTSILV